MSGCINCSCDKRDKTQRKPYNALFRTKLVWIVVLAIAVVIIIEFAG